MSTPHSSLPVYSYFVGPPLGEGWREWIVKKYSQKPELEIFSREGDKGLRSFEETFLSRHMTRKGRVLDIGCGTGREAFPLARMGHEVVGVDMTPAMVEKAREKAKNIGLKEGAVEFQIGEAGNLKFPNESFDYVLMIAQLLQHIHEQKNRLQALNEAWRVLKSNGLLFITIRNQIGLTWSLFMNFLYRRVKGLSIKDPGGNGARGYNIYSPRLWRNGLHGLYIRLLSLGVDSWRKTMKAMLGRLGREYKGREPGDYIVPNISPAISSGLSPFHSYSLKELKNDLYSSGFDIQECRDVNEVTLGIDFPKFVRKGARHLIFLCKKVH